MQKHKKVIARIRYETGWEVRIEVIYDRTDPDLQRVETTVHHLHRHAGWVAVDVEPETVFPFAPNLAKVLSVAAAQDAVTCDTNRYDLIGTYFRERCYQDPEATVPPEELYADYRDWCMGIGEEPMGRWEFEYEFGWSGVYRQKLGRERRGDWNGIRLVREPSVPEKANDPEELVASGKDG